MQLNNFPEYVQDYHSHVSDYVGGGAYGDRVAWRCVKDKLQETDKGMIAESSDFRPTEVYTFELDETEKSIIYESEDGDYMLEAVLTSTEQRADGKYYTEDDLRYMARQINQNGLSMPGVGSHDEFKKTAIQEAMNENSIKKRLKQARGWLDDVTAKVKEGKLWIQSKLDKAMKDMAEQFSGLSIEAVGEVKGDRMYKPNPLGFIFTDNPKNPASSIES